MDLAEHERNTVARQDEAIVSSDRGAPGGLTEIPLPPGDSLLRPKSILAQGFGIHTYGTGSVEDVEVILSGA